VLLEAVREGTQPAAIITTGEDPFFALASITAAELYGKDFPVIAVSPADFEEIMHASEATIQRDGSIELS
jgi:predicted aconitase with swiveling domain